MSFNLQLFGGRGSGSGGGGGNNQLRAYGEISTATYVSMNDMSSAKFAKVDLYGRVNKLQQIMDALNNISPAGSNGVNSGQLSGNEVPIDSTLRGMAVSFSDRISVSETLGLDNINVKDFNGLVSDVRGDLESKMKRKK